MSIINIVADDNVVIIDGDAEIVAFTSNPNIHAIHWNDVILKGEIEYKNKANETIIDFTLFQHFVADHASSKSARVQAEADAAQATDDARAAADAAREEAAEAALTPTGRRNLAYPDIQDQLHALFLARQGDSTALDAIDLEISTVDIQFPL